MKKDNFKIGKEFCTATGKWLCTDIGTRVIVAIHLNQENPINYNGPPYSIPENVFDEYDMEGCSLDQIDFVNENKKIANSSSFGDIEDAMMFVSSAGYGENSAILDRSTGKIYYRSAFGDLDELDEFNEDEFDSDIHIAIPHKNDLNLGKELVFDFVEAYVPEIYEKVEGIFRKRGAYSRYKVLLESKSSLQQWYDYENRRTQQALHRWCEENGIDVKG